MLKRRIAIKTLEIFDLILMLAPLAIVVYLNRAKYFYSFQGYKLSFGFIIVLIFAIILAKTKIKMSPFCWFLIATIVFYLLESLLNDAVLISGMATIGAAIDNFIFSPIINYQKKICEAELTAGINAKAVGEVINDGNNGREVIINERG